MVRLKCTFKQVMDATLAHIIRIRGAKDRQELDRIREYTPHIYRAARLIDSSTYSIVNTLIYTEVGYALLRLPERVHKETYTCAQALFMTQYGNVKVKCIHWLTGYVYTDEYGKLCHSEFSEVIISDVDSYAPWVEVK